MPVKKKRDEEKWEKAKQIAEEAGKKENYAYIMGIYKKMKPDYEFKNKTALRVAARWVVKQADFTTGRIDRQIKSAVLRGFAQKGLDGNGSFRKIGEGLTVAFDILGRFGIEVGQTLSAHLFMGDEGRRSIELAFSNPDDPFSPKEVSNSLLVMSWYKRESGNYEILCYLS
jgi:hypothetical protein